MTSPLALCLLLYVGGVFLDYECFLTIYLIKVLFYNSSTLVGCGFDLV